MSKYSRMLVSTPGGLAGKRSPISTALDAATALATRCAQCWVVRAVRVVPRGARGARQGMRIGAGCIPGVGFLSPLCLSALRSEACSVGFIVDLCNPVECHCGYKPYKPVQSLNNLLQTCCKHPNRFKVFVPKLLKQLSFS